MSDIAEKIKEFLGDTARDIIMSDLGLKEQGGNITCPYPDHEDHTASATWKPYAFHCHACTDNISKKQYDIFTHYEIVHGATFPEAVKSLCDEYGIENDYKESFKIKKVLRAKVNNDYQEKRNQFQNIGSDLATNFFNSKKIDESIARNSFMCETTNTEILIHGHEVINNTWTPVYTKRRKLDLTEYDMNGKTAKEIQIAGGSMAFYGLPTLYNSKGQQKRVALICEGQMDALRMATELQKENMFESIAVLSVPSGGTSLLRAWDNSPFFRRWFNTCDRVVLIPDADATGLKMLDQAKECLCADKTYWINLTKVTGVRYSEKHGIDSSDVFDKFNIRASNLIKLHEHLPVDGLVTADNIDVKESEEGHRSGFITHDYNDSGLKDGRLTIISGIRGHGKTTMAMQMVYCCAKQGVKSFVFFGETAEGVVVGRFSRMDANQDEIIKKITMAGRTDYVVDAIAQDRFKSNLGKNITFYCKDQIKDKGNIFDEMMKRMLIAVKRGAKVFLLDSMMVICQPDATNEFAEQKRIVQALKEFALEHSVHIMLIAHPRSGEGIQKISGAMEQENLADTILYYVRLPNDIDRSKIMNETNINSEDAKKISAVIINKKVRDEGTSFPVYLEWMNQTGTVSEITSPNMPQMTLDISQEYHDNGWFSRPSRRMSQADQPQPL